MILHLRPAVGVLGASAVLTGSVVFPACTNLACVKATTSASTLEVHRLLVATTNSAVMHLTSFAPGAFGA